MDRARRYLERLIPQSAFGVTLLTIAAMILVVGFFVRGIDLVSVNGGVAKDFIQSAERDLGPSGNPVAFNSENNDEWASVPPSGTFVQPSNLYGDNRSEVSSRVAPGYAALLTHTYDCRWADDAQAPAEGAQFKVGQTLDVAAGLVEIAFACGAKAILEGPAVLEIQSEKSGALRVGRLTADVPDEVRGFTVHTPVAQVVSLCASEVGSVAKLTSMTADCLWDEDSEAKEEGKCLQPGKVLKLAEGLAEVTFTSGAKVLLQGPVNLEIESSKAAILHAGRLTADVPDDLEGFRIRTAVVEILSLPSESKATTSEIAPESEPLPPDDPTAPPESVILEAGEQVKFEGVIGPSDEAATVSKESETAPSQP